MNWRRILLLTWYPALVVGIFVLLAYVESRSIEPMVLDPTAMHTEITLIQMQTLLEADIREYITTLCKMMLVIWTLFSGLQWYLQLAKAYGWSVKASLRSFVDENASNLYDVTSVIFIALLLVLG